MKRKLNIRCGICNKVNSAEIATDIGDYSGETVFQEDPKDHNHFICLECYEVIKETNTEFENIFDSESWMEGFKL